MKCKKYLKPRGWLLFVDKVDNLYVITVGKCRRVLFASNDKRRIGRRIRNYQRECQEFDDLSKFMKEKYNM